MQLFAQQRLTTSHKQRGAAQHMKGSLHSEICLPNFATCRQPFAYDTRYLDRIAIASSERLTLTFNPAVACSYHTEYDSPVFVAYGNFAG